MSADFQDLKCKELIERINNSLYKVYNRFGYVFQEKFRKLLI